MEPNIEPQAEVIVDQRASWRDLAYSLRNEYITRTRRQLRQFVQQLVDDWAALEAKANEEGVGIGTWPWGDQLDEFLMLDRTEVPELTGTLNVAELPEGVPYVEVPNEEYRPGVDKQLLQDDLTVRTIRPAVEMAPGTVDTDPVAFRRALAKRSHTIFAGSGTYYTGDNDEWWTWQEQWLAWFGLEPIYDQGPGVVRFTNSSRGDVAQLGGREVIVILKRNNEWVVNSFDANWNHTREGEGTDQLAETLRELRGA